MATGEPAFQLKLEPSDDIVFKGKVGDVITVERTITNTSDVLQCFKIKCTANDIFRVRQPLGFIEPKGSATVKISFIGKTAPDAKKHFFAYYHIATEKKVDNPRTIWSSDAKPLGVARQNCKFELEGAKEEKKEEKKEEEKKDEKKEEEIKDEKKDDEKKEEKKENEKGEEKK